METIECVKKAVDDGKLVNWASDIYEVKYWPVPEGYYVICTVNNFTTGLCHGDVKDCYIGKGSSSYRPKLYSMSGSHFFA